MNELLRAIEEMLDRKLEEKLDQVLDRKLEEKLDQVLDRKLEEKLDQVLDRKLEEKLDQVLDRKLDQVLDRKLKPLFERMDRLEARMDSLEERIKNIAITIENEIRPNIMRVAEGHLDLNRKLDEAVKSDKERENLAIRVNYLDGEVKNLQKWKNQHTVTA